MFQENFGNEFETSIDKEFIFKKLGRIKIDIVANIGGSMIAVECGNTTFNKIQKLKKHFDIVLHVPYNYTSEHWNIEIKEIIDKLAISLIAEELKRRNEHRFERNKIFCLEEGKCSILQNG